MLFVCCVVVSFSCRYSSSSIVVGRRRLRLVSSYSLSSSGKRGAHSVRSAPQPMIALQNPAASSVCAPPPVSVCICSICCRIFISHLPEPTEIFPCFDLRADDTPMFFVWTRTEKPRGSRHWRSLALKRFDDAVGPTVGPSVRCWAQKIHVISRARRRSAIEARVQIRDGISKMGNLSYWPRDNLWQLFVE